MDGKATRARAVGGGDLQGATVGRGEQIGFAGGPARPDGSDGMNHVVGGQPTAGGANGVAGGAASDLAALGHDVGSTGAVDGAIHASAAPEGRVGGVHDGVHLLDGDVALDQGQAGRPDH